MTFYAVHSGRNPGIYKTWDECQVQVKGYSGAKYKKFKALVDAEQFIKGDTAIPNLVTSTSSPLIINDNKTYIYTDGSLVRKNNSVGSGYGLYIPKLNLEESHILPEPKTNNRAELSAIIRAISLSNQYFPENTELYIYTDSKYSILICSGTGLRYQTNNFIVNGKTVPNRDLIEIVLPLVNKNIKFIHILAHTGLDDQHSIGNEKADTLANGAAQRDLLG